MSQKISVVVPCYNQAQYLDECLDSVLNQTYHNWECIIVNDGSPDNTEEIAKKWTAKDSRFRYISKKNGGLSSARNTGIEAATGEWVLPLDADDKIHHEYLSLAAEEFGNNFTLVYADAHFFGTIDKPWILQPFEISDLLVRNYIFCSSFFRKKHWKEIGGYDEMMKTGYEDWEFYIRLLHHFPLKTKKIEKALFYYRKKESSMLTDTHKNENEVLNYIYNKHQHLYQKEFGSFIKVLRTNDVYKGYLRKYDTLFSKDFIGKTLFSIANFIKKST